VFCQEPEVAGEVEAGIVVFHTVVAMGSPHNPVRVGTLAASTKAVAQHKGVARDAVVEVLWLRSMVAAYGRGP
jgi:hypothetical protein